MFRFNPVKSATSIYLLFVSALICISAEAYDPYPGPGKFSCDLVSANVYTTGLCVYQVRPLGSVAFDNLLKYATTKLSDDLSVALSPKVKRPAALDRTAGTISWWFPDDAANTEFGTSLATQDVLPPILEKDAVIVKISMYSFDKSFSRDFGLDLGFFDGKAPAGAADPQKAWGELINGVFKIGSGIGNPAASYLSAAITAQIKNKHASLITEWPQEASAVGTYFENKDEQTYYVSTTSITPIVEKIGFKISYTPRLASNDPTLVTLQGLSLSYASKTGVDISPVRTITPLNGNNLDVHTNEVYTLSHVTEDQDVRTGRLLGGSKSGAHTELLLMLTAQIIRAGKREPDGGFQLLNVRKVEYTPAERLALDDPKLTLKDIFSSLELVCYGDRVDPSNPEPICGYQLTRMSSKYLDYRVNISIKGPVAKESDSESIVRLGDLYRSKGYHRLPMLDLTSKYSTYQLSLNLVGNSAVSKKLRNTEPVKGMKFSFGYYPNTASPIDMNPVDHPDLIKWLE